MTSDWRIDESHGWLALALPAAARRFDVTDPDLVESIAYTGAEIVSDRADVVIELRVPASATAPTLVMNLAAIRSGSGHPLRRLLGRAADCCTVMMRVLRGLRVARRLGYVRSDVYLWDDQQRVPLSPTRPLRPTRRLPLRLQRAAVVVARRDLYETTLFEAVCDDVATETGCAAELFWSPTVAGSGIITASSADAVLRVGVGPAGRRIEMEHGMLVAVGWKPADLRLAHLVPRPLAAGAVGLATWSLESRLFGTMPTEVDDALVAGCLDFLGELFRHGAPDRANGRSHAALAADVGARRPPLANRLAATAARLDDELRDVPRGFGHGDFWRGNLLVAGGALTAVVDWERADSSRLPLLDLIHLRTAERDHAGVPFGHTVRDELIPWARAGGDGPTSEYCRRVEIEPEPALLEALVVSYWLERAAWELRSYRGYERRTGWLEHNLDDVVAAGF